MIYKIRNSDLQEGTYIMEKSGIYQLQEDIVFHPNPEYDFQPKPSQYLKYNPKLGYGLGFFAVFVIQGQNIKFDLNGFSIRCSKEFLLKQRFCAIIELASTPFIPNQGPANFGPIIQSAKNCIIQNGCLGQVSHHGIHGNGMENIKIKNLTIKEYEVAAISLNGGINIIVEDCKILGVSTKVPCLSNYAHCKFDLPFLKKIVKENPHLLLEMQNETKTVQEIYDTTVEQVKIFEHAYMNNLPYNGAFYNETGLYDGNVYGMVFNSLGVVVNGFKHLRDENTIGNENIFIRNTTIENTVSDSTQVLGLFDTTKKNIGAYGKSAFVGPVGDMFNLMSSINSNGVFNNDFVCVMQLAIAKFGKKENNTIGTSNIDSYLYDTWIKSTTNIFSEISMDPDDKTKRFYLVGGSDSMNHKMKGNIGLFISQGLNVNIENVNIHNVQNNGIQKNQQSSQSIGLCITGSKDVYSKKLSIHNINSINSTSNEIELVNENVNIDLDVI